MLRTPDLEEKTKKLSEESEVMQNDSTHPPEVPGVPEALGPQEVSSQEARGTEGLNEFSGYTHGSTAPGVALSHMAQCITWSGCWVGGYDL